MKTFIPAGVCAFLLASISFVAWPLRAQDTNTADGSSNLTTETNSQPIAVEDSENESPARTGVRRDAMVVFGHDATLKAHDSADAVVVIGGSAKVHGKVRETVVAIGGDVEIDGEARDVVAVLGSVKAGRGAKLHGEVVAVGGHLDLEDGVTPGRKPFELDLGGLGIGLRQWMLQCLFKLRPLAPQVGWVWLVAFFFFLIYLIIALVMPGSVQACANELTRRPVTTFFMGLLTKMLVPLITVILAMTGVGAIIVPFVGAALAFGALIGKTAIFEALGFGVGRRFGAGVLQNPLLAFVVGIAVITVLYMVPILGFLTLGVISVWGLGGATTAAFGAMRREAPEKRNSASVPQTGTTSAPGTATMPSAVPSVEASETTAASLPNIPEALSQRRASFWERMGAGILDVILLGILGGLVHGPPFAFLVALVYFVGLWAWKGTTIGGIVLGLKVVRLDGQAVTLMVALVRALAAVFSIFVFFLGFLWIGWDREKQAWHDKIAGTVVVRLPKSVPLICL